ncbi:MAG: hypothetical protein WBD45_02365 [Terriglobales bacterium]
MSTILPMRVLSLLLLLCPLCHAESVKVLVLNGNNGQALSGVPVSVHFIYDKPANAMPPLLLTTSSEGEAEFSLPSSAPERIGVQISLDYYACDCWMLAETKTILQKGVLSKFHGQKVKSGVSLQPGQITFLPRPVTLMERFMLRLVNAFHVH